LIFKEELIMRTPIIAGNWKMHYTVEEAVKTVEALKDLVKDAKCEVVVCPTFVCLDAVKKAVNGTNIKVGAQNVHFEEKGAFTGEIAPGMLQAMGIDFVIIGHSERRQYFNETDETVNKKLKASYAHNLVPILCVGESLEEREANITEEVIGRQIKLDLAGLTAEQVEKLVIAYEPIWAIGTGKTATADQANETIAFIRKCLANLYGAAVADKTRIQYGGSVKPSTIAEQMGKSDIDGALVGGASLVPADFAGIVNY
jgi:triosephosphate isomerase